MRQTAILDAHIRIHAFSFHKCGKAGITPGALRQQLRKRYDEGGVRLDANVLARRVNSESATLSESSGIENDDIEKANPCVYPCLPEFIGHGTNSKVGEGQWLLI